MIHDAPDGWKLARLQDVLQEGGLFDGPFGSDLKTSDYTDSGVRVVRLENLANLRFVEEKRTFISAAKYASLRKHTVSEGDILFGSFLDNAVRVCQMPRLPVPAIAKADCFCIRSRPDLINPRFLMYQLGRPATRDTLIAEIHGATRPRVTTKQLRQLHILFPPLSEQTRIVETIDALLAQLYTARERLDRVREILKRFRQSVLVAACSGRLTEEWRTAADVEGLERALAGLALEQSRSGRAATDDVIDGRCILAVGDPARPAPHGWQWLPLTALARLESGHTPSRRRPEYWDGGVPWIGLPDAREHHGVEITQTSQTVSDLGLANSSARLLPAETVCLSRTASVGYVTIMGRPMATSQDFVNWVCSEALVPRFLMYAIMAEGDGIREFGRGSTHTTIYFPEVKALHICLPPPQEQREIVTRIRRLLHAAELIEHRVANAASSCEVAPRAILTRAFGGELAATKGHVAGAS